MSSTMHANPTARWRPDLQYTPMVMTPRLRFVRAVCVVRGAWCVVTIVRGDRSVHVARGSTQQP